MKGFEQLEALYKHELSRKEAEEKGTLICSQCTRRFIRLALEVDGKKVFGCKVHGWVLSKQELGLGFFKNGHANPTAAVTEMGERLTRLIALKKKQVDLINELWEHYIADCKRFGVKPLRHP